jgi:cytochrome c553
MKTLLSTAASAAALALTLASGMGTAADKPAAKVDLARGSQIASQVCVACHSADGNSAAAANPKLAGQHPEYLAKQLANFKENKTRKNPVMMGFATALTPEDMANVAAYYATQKPKDGAARNAATVKLGEKIYRGGVADKGIAACASCHGPAGAGIPAQYPRVAGQWADYTKAQLMAFRAGERQNDPQSMMRGVAAKLSDNEIAAVADYIAGLKQAN